MLTRVTGVFYANEDGICRANYVQDMNENDIVFLERDPSNKNDSNAVKVIVTLNNAKHQIGFIEKELAAQISPLMTKGEIFPVWVVRCGFYRFPYCEIDIQRVKPDKADKKWDNYQMNKLLATKIENINLSTRTLNVLQNNYIQTIADLVKNTKEDISQLSGMGEVCMSEIENYLLSVGLCFEFLDDRIEDVISYTYKSKYP